MSVASAQAHPRVPRSTGAAIGSAVAIAACTLWALRPLEPVNISVPTLPPAPDHEGPPDPARADLAVFRTPLWVAPPPPPPPVIASPIPPLRLQLIAIVREDGALKAVLYDQDADRLVVAGPGDTIAGRTIERVGAADLTINDGGQTRTLSLRDDGGAP